MQFALSFISSCGLIFLVSLLLLGQYAVSVLLCVANLPPVSGRESVCLYYLFFLPIWHLFILQYFETISLIHLLCANLYSQFLVMGKKKFFLLWASLPFFFSNYGTVYHFLIKRTTLDNVHITIICTKIPTLQLLNSVIT